MVLMLDPTTSQAIQNNLADALSRFRGVISDPVIVTPPKIRRHVKTLLERHFSKIVVLSYSEIVPGVQIEALETIEATQTDTRGHGTAFTTASSARTEGEWMMSESAIATPTPIVEEPEPPTFELGLDAISAFESSDGERPPEADAILRQLAETIRKHARGRQCRLACRDDLVDPVKQRVGEAYPDVDIVPMPDPLDPEVPRERSAPDYIAVPVPELGDAMGWNW
jgi:hypothetical protein